MGRRGPRTAPDDEVLDVVVLEDEEAREEDEYLALLHAIALAAIALRATSPGDPRTFAEAPSPPGASDDGAPRGPRGRLRRRGTRLAAAAVVAALALVVGATVVDARRDAQRRAVLAADPAVLATVTVPPVELWRASGPPVPGAAPEGWSGDSTDAGTAAAVARAGTEEEHDLPDDARATWSWAADGTFDRGLVVVGPERGYALPGPLLLPEVSDGSFPRTLLTVPTAGTSVRALTLRTGGRLWSWTRAGSGPLTATALVDGVVLLDEGDAVTALDVRDGTVLWRTALDPAVRGDRTPTDGTVVLLPVPGSDGPELLGVRITDGEGLWRTRLPAGTDRLAVVDHRLVASTGDGVLVGLG